jgi:hypothetical protein
LPLLSEAGLWESLREALAAIDLASLSTKEQAIALQALASVHIHLGDAKGAGDALAGMDRPVEDPEIEKWLVAIDALLLAVRGEAARALALIGPETQANEPALRASHQIVRAHAWMAQGDEQRARKALTAVLKVAGEPALRRALMPTGPASDIAASLLPDNV